MYIVWGRSRLVCKLQWVVVGYERWWMSSKLKCWKVYSKSRHTLLFLHLATSTDIVVIGTKPCLASGVHTYYGAPLSVPWNWNPSQASGEKNYFIELFIWLGYLQSTCTVLTYNIQSFTIHSVCPFKSREKRGIRDVILFYHDGELLPHPKLP